MTHSGRTAPRPGAAADTFTFGRLPEQGGAAPPAAATADRNRANFDPDPAQLRWWQQPRNAVTVSGASNKDIEAFWGSAAADPRVVQEELTNSSARKTNSECDHWASNGSVPRQPSATGRMAHRGALHSGCRPCKGLGTPPACHPCIPLPQRRRGWAAPSRPAWATPRSSPWRRQAPPAAAASAQHPPAGRCLSLPRQCGTAHGCGGTWRACFASNRGQLPQPDMSGQRAHPSIRLSCSMQTNAAIPPQAQSTYKSDMTAGHVRVGKRGVCLPPEAMAAVSEGCGAAAT